MRENWARLIALFSGLIVLLLAAIFAYIQNPTSHSGATESREQLDFAKQQKSTSLDSKLIEAGRRVYGQQACARCHSIAGEGNPRNSLDGVGTRYTAQEIREWITAADTLQEELPVYVLRSKQKYRGLQADDLDALVIYLQSLRL